MPKLPDNPYRIPHQPMPEVPLGQHAPGGVTYLPHFATQASPPAHVDSYALLVYSDERASRAMARNHESQRYPLPNGAEAQVPWDYVLMVLLSDPATTRQ